MIGILIGTLSLAGLIGLKRMGRRHSYAYGGCGSYGGPSRHGFGRENDCGGDHPYRGNARPFGDENARENNGEDDHEFGGPFERSFGRGAFGRRGFWGRRWFLGAVFEKLRTTKEQETKLLELVKESKEHAKELRKKMAGSKKELADALRSESFDETLVGGFQASVEQGLDDLRAHSIATLAKLHAILDEGQRKELADMIERGPRSWAM
ncbi:MAG: Spy/CpxP family protein refolding chaperone [Polyangiaceae bacterium]|nr:Spy/CpxP family protein refolding chaperone [Polyangiaceae bacterium]